MSQFYKICPICKSTNHRNTAICSTCGATISNTPPTSPDNTNQPNNAHYQHNHGETDLLENNFHWNSKTYIISSVLIFSIILCIGILILLTQQTNNTNQPSNASPNLTFTTSAETNNQNEPPLTTNTLQPPLTLATVTQGPPTSTFLPSPTITPTESPCVQEVQAGDDLISILIRCGHRDMEPILSTVLPLNNLADPSRIQQGQIIEIPWPTPTIDANSTPSAAPTNENRTTGDTALNPDGETVMGVRLVPTETLQPGVTWHTVIKDETIITIAVQYGATLRILSELNPQITFSQCDFGIGTGGPNCVVQLSEGQQVRVPAPTPTPTIQPTASGSETATPSATPTYNIPTILNPSNRAFFRSSDIITLRWIATGALNTDESYLIQVENQTTGQVFSATTRELFFIIPNEWHNPGERQDYSWTLSIINENNPDRPRFITETRLFTWQGT